MATDNSSLSLKSEASSLSPRIVRSTTNEQPSITVVSLFLFTTLLFFFLLLLYYLLGLADPLQGGPPCAAAMATLGSFVSFGLVIPI